MGRNVVAFLLGLVFGQALGWLERALFLTLVVAAYFAGGA